MRLQLALDAPEHLALVPRLTPFFDIIEVGTPVLKRFGLTAITTVAELSGGAEILADTKTVDGGALEAAMVFGAGASAMTVLAQASPATRTATLEVARAHGGTVIFDTILDGTFDVATLADLDQDELWLALHAPSDARLAGNGTEDHIARVADRRQRGCRVSLAGGIGRTNLEKVLAVAPDVIVIGSSVTGAANPEKEASWLSTTVAQARG
ncbi:orotidine 5'-phosphate decarboxylase / HUMPS family protein [Georgenia subflava]|uniref:orotidine 5'-phosphate decarboxylase / HUMPS family protein n=1 Tax=Georgenia subflava TaxID=1622177 RepID=UPI00186AF7AA|nr:orotidine 5'-phosphate decarboxylase / HUMPS family protein [Georgenia subflava]